jgi:hypothetical protein
MIETPREVKSKKFSTHNANRETAIGPDRTNTPHSRMQELLEHKHLFNFEIGWLARSAGVPP